MEKLWDAHASCITLLHCQLVRTERLVHRFPLASCTFIAGVIAARTADESRPAGCAFAAVFFIYFKKKLTIPVRPIISKSIRMVLAEFSGLIELRL